MYASVYDIRQFYATRLGRLARRIILKKIQSLWPDVKGQTVLGLGYATPYLTAFKQEAETCFALMPANLGVHQWPEPSADKQLNSVALTENPELPLETNSVDRILLVHSIEYAEMLKPNLQELWRVLKSNGRIIIVVPNRIGLWAGSDKTPFGEGTPYTVGQISFFLRDNYFVHEHTAHSLYLPPTRAALLHKLSGGFEKFGSVILPAFAGVHIVEASKQIYAGVSTRAQTGKAVVRGRRWLVPTPPTTIKYPKAHKMHYKH